MLLGHRGPLQTWRTVWRWWCTLCHQSVFYYTYPTLIPSSMSVGATWSPRSTTNLANCLTLMIYFGSSECFLLYYLRVCVTLTPPSFLPLCLWGPPDHQGPPQTWLTVWHWWCTFGRLSLCYTYPTLIPSSISVGATWSPRSTTNLANCLTLMMYFGSSESAWIIFVHLATCNGCSPAQVIIIHTLTILHQDNKSTPTRKPPLWNFTYSDVICLHRTGIT